VFKFLATATATATAFLTVVTGAPRVQCVCPDGRVKFHCPGSSTSRCCCDTSSAPGPIEVVPNRSKTDGETHACCARAKSGASDRLAGVGQTQTVEPCGCQRTLVADALASTAEKAGDGDRFEAGAVAAWVEHPVVPKQTTRSDRIERRFLLPPSDRVVLFCHFTC
jgi:hypothetical protein